MPQIPFPDLELSPFMRAMGLVIDECSGGDDGGCTLVRGHVDAGPEHHTPNGIVHGGLYSGVIETAVSVGATLAVRAAGQFAVGVDNLTDFVRPVVRGRLDVEARAASQGRTLQLWEAGIRDDRGRLVAQGRVRLYNRERPDSQDRPDSQEGRP